MKMASIDPYQDEVDPHWSAPGRLPQHGDVDPIEDLDGPMIRGSPALTIQNQSLHFRSLRGSNATIAQPHHLPPPPVINISQGCLLIPVFWALWVYYTKRCVRRIRGFLRNSPEPEDDSERFNNKFNRYGDDYARWEDVEKDKGSSTTSERFVKWINRRNVKSRYQKHELKVRTKEYLSTTEEPMAKTMERLDSTLGNSTLGDYFVDETVNVSVMARENLQWECISDIGEMGELCARVTAVLSPDDDGIPPPSSVRSSRSNEELQRAERSLMVAQSASQAGQSEGAAPFDESPVDAKA